MKIILICLSRKTQNFNFQKKHLKNFFFSLKQRFWVSKRSSQFLTIEIQFVLISIRRGLDWSPELQSITTLSSVVWWNIYFLHTSTRQCLIIRAFKAIYLCYPNSGSGQRYDLILDYWLPQQVVLSYRPLI